MERSNSRRAFAAPFIVLAVVVMVSSASQEPKRPSSVSFYMHDTLQNKTHPWTDTAVEVAGPHHNLTGLGFGKIIVFNDSLTDGPSLASSKVVGKGQGVYIYDHTQAGVAFNALLLFSALIETGEYNGTINFMGADVILAPSRDISVVGGTGDFEMARGIATITTHSIDGDTFIVLFKIKLIYW
ncbi:disease resistance response protein 206 [Selaginella moellendorffii]|nr:disease resistance response protein 206 [Selaginella moellendorffii]|eukprot:XP_002971526.2 disease resistance response protein 206 [Selaginella moellendorffii]